MKSFLQRIQQWFMDAYARRLENQIDNLKTENEKLTFKVEALMQHGTWQANQILRLEQQVSSVNGWTYSAPTAAGILYSETTTETRTTITKTSDGKETTETVVTKTAKDKPIVTGNL